MNDQSRPFAGISMLAAHWRPLAAVLSCPLGVVLALVIAFVSPTAGATETPAFEKTEITSQNGASSLAWSGDADEYEVSLVTPQGETRSVYRGSFATAHVSGLPNGVYQVTVRARTEGDWTSWSAPAQITVKHHDMATVWFLFFAGFVCVAATALVLLFSSRRPSA